MPGNFLTGYGATTEQLPLRDPWGVQLQQWIGNQGQQTLGQNQPFNFAPIRQQAENRFRTETVPSIADRFLGMGNTRNSSGFQHALGSAASDLQTNLAGLQAQYDYQSHNQQQQNALQMLGMGLAPSYENIYTPASSGVLGGLLQGASPEIAKGVLAALGLGPYAANLLKDTTKQTATDAVTNATTGAVVGGTTGAAMNAVTPAATTTPAATAPLAGAAGTTAAAGGIGKTIGGALASGLGPAAVTLAAIGWGLMQNSNKKQFDKDWKIAKQEYDAGRIPWAPATKQKAFYKQVKAWDTLQKLGVK